MYNLYQSKLRKKIQGSIYRNPTFTVELFGKEYFGTIKRKTIGNITTERYQIMGVELPEDKNYIRKEIKKIKKEYSGEGFFFQLGIINEIVSFENSQNKCPEFREDLKNIRLGLQKCLYSDFGFNASFRENMPTAGIIYDVTKSDEELLKDMNSSCRKRIKKSTEGGLKYGILTSNDYEQFFVKWQATADIKGFTTITKAQYHRLTQYIDEGNGIIIGAFLDGELIAGTICLFDGSHIYCPYGFFYRKFSNIGVQHFLKFQFFSRARENGFKTVDTGGGSPTGFPEHPLAGVSAFKESLGGTKTELYGSYDIVLNRFLYRIFKLRYSFLHK